MKLRSKIALLVCVLMTGPVFAGSCPKDMKAIDAALATATLSDEDRAKVMSLREQGEALHSSGSHKESVEALHEALKMLGVEKSG